MNDFPSDFAVGCADEGQGRPLVLVHCSGADRHVWDKMLEAWSASGILNGRRVIRPELFGSGRTPAWPGGRAATLHDYVALLDRALAGIAEPVDLVGHSFGGAASLFYALHRPQRIRTLTLIEPTAFFLLRQDGETGRRLFDEIAGVAATIRSETAMGTGASLESAMHCFFDYWNGAGRWLTLPASVRQSMAKLAPNIVREFNVLFFETTLLAAFRELDAPALVIAGDASPEPARHIAAMLPGTLPLAEHVTVRGAGHMMTLTHAARVAALIASWQLGDEGSLVPFRKASPRILASQRA